MTLRITIGSNEKNITEGENLVLYTLFDGQQAYDFFISEENQGIRKHYRLVLGSPKNVSERFSMISFRNAGSISSVQVIMDGQVIRPIPDVVEFFRELHKSAETDPTYFWKMLGLSESVIEDKSIDASASYLEKTYHSYPDIPPIIHEAADRRIKKIRDSYGSLVLSLDLEGIELYIDGKKRGDLGTPLAITAGKHRIEIRKGSATISSEDITVEAKSSNAVKLSLGKNNVGIFQRFRFFQ